MVLDPDPYDGNQVDRMVWVGGEGGHIVCFDTRMLKAFENSVIMPHQHYRAALQAAIPCDESPIKCLKVGNDGKLLAFSLQSYQGAVIYVYDTDPLHYKKDLKRPKYAFATREGGGEFDFSPDDKYLLSAGPRGSVIVWNLENGRTVAELPSARWNISCLKWRADRRGRRWGLPLGANLSPEPPGGPEEWSLKWGQRARAVLRCHYKKKRVR